MPREARELTFRRKAPTMTSLLGKWTYRSFHNNPALVTSDPQKALGLFFAEAIFSFSEATDASIRARSTGRAAAWISPAE